MMRTGNSRLRLTAVLLALAILAACGTRTETKSVTKRIRGFHIDMNIAQFRGPYLKQELRTLADLGYNTIVWEVENNIRWETCPECVSPDAFTKSEFRDILAYSRDLGLEPVPLLQTLGHCEYVLKNERYAPLAEVPGRIDQYCPRNPEVVTFLKKWINEYLAVFGRVRYFHLGADEAYTLGECPRCKAYAAEHSLSELFIGHINSVAAPLIERGIRPVIWGDMLLHHPEALEKLSRRVVIFDWLYDRYNGLPAVRVWGKGDLTREEMDELTFDKFGAYIYPMGDEPARDPDPFYTADYLADNGFDVVLCPSSSWYGDSVFAPRTYQHLRNTLDSFRKGSTGKLKGAVLTSWTVHLFPWELQKPSLELPRYLSLRPHDDLEEYELAYVREHFGLDNTRFFAAVGRLARRGLFNYAADLGYFKDAGPAPIDYVSGRVEAIAKGGELDKELRACESRLTEYREGLALLGAYSKVAIEGQAELKAWNLAGRNLINRAEASRILLLARRDGVVPETAAEAGRILDGLLALRRETEAEVGREIKPSRTAEIMAWIYDSVEAALEKIAGRKSDV